MAKTYKLFMRDNSGRGYKLIHEFETESEREDFVTKILEESLDVSSIEDEEEFQHAIDFRDEELFRLETGGTIEIDATTFEYI